MRVTPKAPGDVVEYVVTFKGLGTDTINSLSTSASGITIASPSPSYSGAQVTVWVSGGSAGTTGVVTITIGTAGGRTFVRTLDIPIEVL